MSDFTFSEYHPLKPNNQTRKRKKPLNKSKNSQTNKDQSWPRRSLFRKVWQKIQSAIDERINSLIEDSADDLSDFFQKENFYNNRGIPTAMMDFPSFTIPPKIIQRLECDPNFNIADNETIIYVELEGNKHESIQNVYKKIIMQIQAVKPELLELLKELNDVLLVDPLMETMSKENIKLMLVIYGLENFDQKFMEQLVSNIKLWWKEKIFAGWIIFQSNRFKENLLLDLPPRCTDCLNHKIIENKFNKDQILEYFEELICQEDYQFKLHPVIVQKLMLFFDCIEFSFENFLLLLKTYVLYFIFNEPLSVICDDDPIEFDNRLSSDSQLLKSFYQLMPPDPHNNYDRHQYINFIHKSYRRLLSENQTYCFNIQILLKFLKFLEIPIESFFHYYTRIYNETDYDYQQNLLKKLLNVSEKSMLTAMARLLENFEEIENDLLNVMQIDKAKLEEIHNLKEAEQNENCEKTKLENVISVLANSFSRIKSRKELRKTLKPVAKMDQSQYEQWRLQFIENIQKTLADTPFLKKRNLVKRLFCLMTSGNDYPSSRQNLDLLKQVNCENPPNFSIMLKYFKENKDLNLEKWFEYFCQKTKSTEKTILPLFLNQIANFEWIGLLKRKQFTFTKECFF